MEEEKPPELLPELEPLLELGGTVPTLVPELDPEPDELEGPTIGNEASPSDEFDSPSGGSG